MEQLAKALLALDWSDMDAFADTIRTIAVDEDGDLSGVREIAAALIDWAEDNAEGNS